MSTSDHRGPVGAGPHTHQSPTFDALAEIERRRGRELAAPSVRRIQLRAARELRALKTAQAHELSVIERQACLSRRRSLVRLVGSACVVAFAWAFVASTAPQLSVADDFVTTWREFEVTHAPVRVAQAQAEPQLGFTVTVDAPHSVVSSEAPRRTPAAPRGVPCTGDPFDPMNFCL